MVNYCKKKDSDKSINLLIVVKFKFILAIFISVIFNDAISVDKFDLIPYCCGDNKLFVLKYQVICQCITFSKTFERAGKTEIGR